MADSAVLKSFSAKAHVDAAVFGLRPDYRALLLAVPLLPLGGVDLNCYVGAPRLVCASGQLREDTTTSLFILDVLEPMTDVELRAAGDDLVDHFRRLGPDVRVVRRLISGNRTTDEGD